MRTIDDIKYFLNKYKEDKELRDLNAAYLLLNSLLIEEKQKKMGLY